MCDAVGLGSGARGDARIANEQRTAANKPMIYADPYCGSEAVYDPRGELVTGRRNEDTFANLKAQSWWALRQRFQNVHRMVVEGRRDVDADSLIALAPHLKELPQLLSELSKITYSINGAGRIVIDKTPPGCRSPNFAGCVMHGVQSGHAVGRHLSEARGLSAPAEAPSAHAPIDETLAGALDEATAAKVAGVGPAHCANSSGINRRAAEASPAGQLAQRRSLRAAVRAHQTGLSSAD
jgi:hypothetical protein